MWSSKSKVFSKQISKLVFWYILKKYVVLCNLLHYLQLQMLLMYFFSVWIFFCRNGWYAKHGERGELFLNLSTISFHLQTLKHLFAVVHLRFLPHVFNSNRWNYCRLLCIQIYPLIEVSVSLNGSCILFDYFISYWFLTNGKF